MKKFALFAGIMMIVGCFAGLGAALDPLDASDKEADPDQDGLKNWEEFLYMTDPNDPDSDGGGTYDGWEIWYENHRAIASVNTGEAFVDDSYHFDANDARDEGVVANPHLLIQVRDGDASKTVNDPDDDGWNNLHEFLVGSDPTNPNTDGDGFSQDSADPDPLVSNDDNPGDEDIEGNGGPGSGEGKGWSHCEGAGNGGGGSGVME